MVVAPPLVFPNGQLMRPKELQREIAAPRMMSVRSIHSGHPANGMTAGRLGQMLLAAEQGDATAYLELAEDMEEKDLHYLSVLGTRKRAVAQLDITVEAASDSAEHKADAELVKQWLDRDTLEEEIFDILDAIGKGYSVCEIIWEMTSSTWLPLELKWRDPRWFEFDRIDGETLRLRTAGEPEPLSAAKFIVHKAKAKSGLPIRGGLARAVAWGYMFKNFSMKDWLSFLEVFGLPFRVGRYDNGESEENIAILMDAVAQLGADAAAVFPRTMDVEFIDGKTGAAPADLWKAMADYIDEQVSKAVLGQTNSADAKAGGLGSGQAELHNDVRGDIERADAKQLAATLNRDLVRPIVILNNGPRDRYPRLKIGRPDQVDVEAMVTAAERLVPLGMKVGARQLREAVGLPEPEAGEEVLAPAQNPAQDVPEGESGPLPPESRPTHLLDPLKSPTGGNREPVERAASASTADRPDPIALAADEALDDWEALMTPVLAPIDALVASATSLEEVRSGLIGALAQMDETRLTELVRRARFGARLQGDADARAAMDDGNG